MSNIGIAKAVEVLGEECLRLDREIDDQKKVLDEADRTRVRAKIDLDRLYEQAEKVRIAHNAIADRPYAPHGLIAVEIEGRRRQRLGLNSEDQVSMTWR